MTIAKKTARKPTLNERQTKKDLTQKKKSDSRSYFKKCLNRTAIKDGQSNISKLQKFRNAMPKRTKNRPTDQNIRIPRNVARRGAQMKIDAKRQ